MLVLYMLEKNLIMDGNMGRVLVNKTMLDRR
jgi:hypothetical protein